MTTMQETPGRHVDHHGFHTARIDRARGRLRRWTDPGVVHVAGDVDLCTAPDFSDVLAQCDADPCVQALDLSRVGFFSAAGVRCFVERSWTVRPHAAIIASPSVRQVLTLCDLEFLLGRHGWRTAYDGWRVGRYPAF